MKMTRKIATVLFIVFLASIWIAYASYMIYSNEVTINVSKYTLTLAATPLSVDQYELVTLQATLDLDGSPVGVGHVIHFYQGEAQLGTSLTDSIGVATFVWNATNVGSIKLKAGYEVT